MKSRIQLAGVPHGSRERTLWGGDLPMFSGIPGMRLVLITPQAGDVPEFAEAYQFRQVCVEINTKTNEYEQVIYVGHVDKTKQHEILG